MTDIRALLDKVTIEAPGIDELDYDIVRDTLSRHTLVRIRGLFDADAIRAATRRMADKFDPGNDRKHDPGDTRAVLSNFQKIVIGCNQGSAERTLSRCVRIFYNPIFRENIHGMRTHLTTLACYRNLLGGKPRDYAVYGIDEGQFTGARIHHYPTGCGFMAGHRDYFSPINAAVANAEYGQPVLIMSKYGEDYHQGGGFIVLDGKVAAYEQFCEPGDVITYNGQSIHGVADIDPLEPIDLTSFSGRVVALVSLYRVLEAGDREYRELSKGTRAYFGDISTG